MYGGEFSGISWAEQVEFESLELPPPHEEFDSKNNIKTVTEYKLNEDGKKVRVVKSYKVESKKVLKPVAKRRAWQKFGAAETDPPGPNPANTIISEDIVMEFIYRKAMKMQDVEEDPLAKLRGTKMVTCRICTGDHWTSKCPYKDALAPGQDILTDERADGTGHGLAAGAAAGGKYVPPSKRNGGSIKGESLEDSRDDEAKVIVSNLSEFTTEQDLRELFGAFGRIARLYSPHSKDFAFVSFHNREDAAKAIKCLDGFGYDHLILKVTWVKERKPL